MKTKKKYFLFNHLCNVPQVPVECAEREADNTGEEGGLPRGEGRQGRGVSSLNLDTSENTYTPL